MAVAAAIGAGVGLAASTAGSIMSARAQRKAQEKLRDQEVASIADLRRIRERLTGEALGGDFLGRYGTGDIFGKRPEEIDIAESVQRNALTNLDQLPLNQQLVDRVNLAGSQDAIERASMLDPNFRQNIVQLSDSARALLRGEIPEDVLSSIQRGRAEGTAGGIGIPGAVRNATSRDLGMTSLDLQQRGASLFQQINAARQAIDPVERQVSLSQLLMTPEQQINADIANRALRASHDPAAQQLFNLDLIGGREEAFARGKVKVPVDNTLGAGLSAFGGGLMGLVSGGVFSGTPTRTHSDGRPIVNATLA